MRTLFLFLLGGAVLTGGCGRLFWRLCRQRRFYEEKLEEQELLQQQNQSFQDYGFQLERQVEELYRLRHDMVNNYVLELSYLEQGKLELLKAHYAVRLGQMKSVEKLIHTGNMGIDSLLNYKLEEARRRQIAVRWKVQTTGMIRILDGDLNMLLGNLLDNALEAAEKVEMNKRVLSFGLNSDGGVFSFEIKNTCLPIAGWEERSKRGLRLKTDKKNAREHGFGLGQVRRVVKKYQGKLEIRLEEEAFYVSVVLYMKEEGISREKL